MCSVWPERGELRSQEELQEHRLLLPGGPGLSSTFPGMQRVKRAWWTFLRSYLACKEEMFDDLQRNVSLYLEALRPLWAGWLRQGSQDRGVPGLPA